MTFIEIKLVDSLSCKITKSSGTQLFLLCLWMTTISQYLNLRILGFLFFCDYSYSWFMKIPILPIWVVFWPTWRTYDSLSLWYIITLVSCRVLAYSESSRWTDPIVCTKTMIGTVRQAYLWNRIVMNWLLVCKGVFKFSEFVVWWFFEMRNHCLEFILF